nr:ATP-binding protein [uncultured Clostridium sp.]
MFDKFYQCEESHKKSGSGLGLSISKRIVELLNGTIECKSKKDSGTTFEVTLLQQ